jgi:hypothetical protein
MGEDRAAGNPVGGRFRTWRRNGIIFPPVSRMDLLALPHWRRPLRSTHSTQLAAAKAILDAREAMVTEWADWLVDRAGSRSIPRPLVERQYHLLIDAVVEMLGPLRRDASPIWEHVTEHYGRTAAARGLAAGEVVEELQQLRVLLIKHIGAFVAAMRPRRAVAVFLRLNAVIDRGIVAAVVGYTDALVASLMMTDRHTTSLTEANGDDFTRQIVALEAELGSISARG